MAHARAPEDCDLLLAECFVSGRADAIVDLYEPDESWRFAADDPWGRS